MNILDLLYPKRCAICDRLLTWREQTNGNPGCCALCEKDLPFVKQPYCYKCGKPFPYEDMEYCEDCRKHNKTFASNRALFIYDDKIKESISNFKFHNRREYAKFYAEQIVRQYAEEILTWNLDGITAVPVHRKKKRERGYNQAECVAKEISKLLSLPYYDKVLLRTVNTLPQKELNNVERLKNLEKAFQLGENSVKLKQILIIDDIYTTGATLEACSRILKSGGASEVYSITVAIGQGY